MNENEEANQAPASAEEVSVDTTDVRAAIERANENLQAAEEADTSAQSGFTAAEHADINTVGMQIAKPVEMPTAAPTPVEHSQPEVEQAAVVPAPAQNPVQQQVSIPDDHPMAPLYIQQPMPPTLKANRLAGVLISLLATIAFQVLYAGLIALTLAPKYTPSTFLQEGLLPYLTSLGFVLPAVGFFVAMVLLVLIFNRAGWWVYAVLGVFVAVIVWGAAGAGYSLSPQLFEGTSQAIGQVKPFDIARMANFAVTLPAFLAAIAAREVTVWFGSWIGARGRKVKLNNEALVKEYEQKMNEVQTKVL